MAAAISVNSVSKAYGTIKALDDISMSIEQGTVFGLLGPNGAGKTTLVRILSTLLKPDRGQVTILGLNVVQDAVAIRSKIGLAGQYAAVDQTLTGFENLEMVGQLYNLSRAEARRRTEQLLERIDLAPAAHRPVHTYSGGMQRRLDLAAGLVGRPQVMIMDEPTTGLDPRSRIELWEIMEEMVEEGTTLVLTTQYLEEADRLANRIAVIDTGRLIIEGTPDELKDRMEGDVLEVAVEMSCSLDQVAEILGRYGEGVDVDHATRWVGVSIGHDTSAVLSALRALDESGITITDLQLRRPTLDDVFLALTGSPTQAPTQPNGHRTSRRQPARTDQ